MISSLSIQAIIYIACFILVWIGSGLVVSSITEISKSWKLPAFIISFFILGILTSLPEITIGSIAILNDDPAIVAGNLLGGIIVMFLGVIPLLGVIGNGIRIPKELDRRHLLLILLVVITPAFLTADQRIGKWEGIFMILMYLTLFAFFSFKPTILEKVKKNFSKKKKMNPLRIGKIILGVIILIGASNQIVSTTLFFADVFSISPFFVSLIVVALGTNIPEISIAFRSVITGKKDIALADYLGSASANTLLLGVFTLAYGKTIQLPNHFLQRFAFLSFGLVLFFFFARSQNKISRLESAALIGVYICFVLFELLVIANIA